MELQLTKDKQLQQDTRHSRKEAVQRETWTCWPIDQWWPTMFHSDMPQ